MEWLKNWDDLTHGTAVFSAAIPFLLTFALAFISPPRCWWALVALALAPVSYWLFKFPGIPPAGSDDVVFAALAIAVVVLLVESAANSLFFKTAPRLLLRAAAFSALAWSIYPAWLAADGGTARKLVVALGFGASIALVSTLAESAGDSRGRPRSHITPAAFIPPAIALAVLLQTGGSMRFAQVSGALAAALAALCLALLIRKSSPGVSGSSQPKSAALGAIMIVMLGWSGWLFAEVRYVLASTLLAAPLAAAVAAKFSSIPRNTAIQRILWDTVFASLVSVPVALAAAIQYSSESAEFEGY